MIGHTEPALKTRPAQADVLLCVRQLQISVPQPGRGQLLIVDRADLAIAPAEIVGLVGESGSGKSMLCRAILGTLHRHGASISGGAVVFNGMDLTRAPERAWRSVRGMQIGYVPQSSQAGLNPILTVEHQLSDGIRRSGITDGSEIHRRSRELLDLVRIGRADEILASRPDQLSGGMRQRVVIAAAIAARPRLLIADEPTTALDASIQHEILKLLASLRRDLGMALLLVTHDLAVVEQTCDRMSVMYAGASMEEGLVDEVIAGSLHPYTRALRDSSIHNAIPGTRIPSIVGDPVSVGRWPDGCRFHPRCSFAAAECALGGQPEAVAVGTSRTACLRWEELPR